MPYVRTLGLVYTNRFLKTARFSLALCLWKTAHFYRMVLSIFYSVTIDTMLQKNGPFFKKRYV